MGSWRDVPKLELRNECKLKLRNECTDFLSGAARGFYAPEPEGPADHYAACLQGVALLERLCYQVLDGVAGTPGQAVYNTGGGSRSDVWVRCRAAATGRTIHRPCCAESAFGAAVLAAAGLTGASLGETIQQMVRIERTFTPEPARSVQYADLFGRFCDELRKRGYL